MKTKLYFSPKIELRKSKIHGWGVFAKYDIYPEEILEESPFLILPIDKGESSSLFIDYRFNYPSGDWKYQVLPMGFSCFYNHSNEPNAGWHTDIDNELFIFTSNKFISKDEEILVYYGDNSYWVDGRQHTILK